MRRLQFAAVVIALCVVLVGGVTPATAQSGNTWVAYYYNNPDWAGAPVTTAYLSFLSLDWGYGSPSPYVPVDNFSARFATDVFFYAGTYNFSTVADDEMTLTIDGVTYVDTRGKGQSGKSFNLSIPMWQGTHHIEVLYREWTETAYVYVNWAYMGGGTVPPPTPPPAGSTYPTVPPSASSVQTKYGDYTPCLQQKIQQANCFVSDGAWDSPNVGSIQMEPQIESWVNCTPPDQDQKFYVNPENPAKGYRCSKTLAGWFPQ